MDVQDTKRRKQVAPREVRIESPKQWRIGNILARIVYFWTIFGVITLSLRVLLLMFSANTETRFVTFIYETSSRYLEPFRGIFPARSIGDTGYFDVSALFAIVMYILFLWGVIALIEYVERNLNGEDHDTNQST